MNELDEQKMIHAIAGLAQSVNKLLTLFNEMHEQRTKADERIIELLKLISRKH